MQLNVSYRPEAECPRFRQYLREVIDEDQIPLVQEMMGYFLVPVTRGQKCFVIVGEGGAGKSQLLLVLKYQENLREADIASILHMPRGTVSSRINTLLKKIREDMNGEGKSCD